MVAPSPVPPTRTTGRQQGHDQTDDPEQPPPARRPRTTRTPTPSPALAPTSLQPQLSVWIEPTRTAPNSLHVNASTSISTRQAVQDVIITWPVEPMINHQGRGTAATDVWYNIIPIPADHSTPASTMGEVISHKPSEGMFPHLKCKMCK
jgi:hypothetical protein